MVLKAWRFATLLLAALALTMTSAHVLELPQKLEYGPELYAIVKTTLYRYFAIVGGAYTVSAIVAAAEAGLPGPSARQGLQVDPHRSCLPHAGLHFMARARAAREP